LRHVPGLTPERGAHHAKTRGTRRADVAARDDGAVVRESVGLRRVDDAILAHEAALAHDLCAGRVERRVGRSAVGTRCFGLVEIRVHENSLTRCSAGARRTPRGCRRTPQRRAAGPPPRWSTARTRKTN